MEAEAGELPARRSGSPPARTRLQVHLLSAVFDCWAVRVCGVAVRDQSRAQWEAMPLTAVLAVTILALEIDSAFVQRRACLISHLPR